MAAAVVLQIIYVIVFQVPFKLMMMSSPSGLAFIVS